MESNTLFTNATPAHGNIVINWRNSPADDIVAFAAGYKNAAQELVSSLSRAPCYADHRGFPILYLYRHAIELYLKAVLHQAAKLQRRRDRSAKPFKRFGHSLTSLLSAVEKTIQSLRCCPYGIAMLPESIRGFISQVEEVDPRSDSFRYPVTINGDPNHDPNTVVNILFFAKGADAILDELVCACIFFQKELSKP
jgi:hypothetical protein